jgi:protein SCO1/2
VLNVDRARSFVTISHDAVPGLMDAMAMPFELRGDARSTAIAPGDRVRFRLSITGSRSWIDRVELLSAAPIDAGLQQTPAMPTLVRVGTAVPDFTLIDQSDAQTSLSDFKGKVVAVNFIYTRCPLPDYCPRMVSQFRAVRDRFGTAMDRDLVLLTISFDPQYDTPERLRDYAVRHDSGGPGWRFLTGDQDRIERVCAAFGIQYWAEEGLITHSLQTAVIDRQGRLAAMVEGKDFTPKQLGDLIESVLTNTRSPQRLPSPRSFRQLCQEPLGPRRRATEPVELNLGAGPHQLEQECWMP